jgi:hypothetical protein
MSLVEQELFTIPELSGVGNQNPYIEEEQKKTHNG